MEIRTGIGYDLHRLVNGRPLIIGGITIPHNKGMLAHSDGDALIHAIIDALFGAAGLGDIGTHFPDSDPIYKGIDSTSLLKHAVNLIYNAEFTINNIDTIIVCQKPKLAPFIPPMRTFLAEIMELNEDVISIKAKTKENVGAIGKGKAIETFATCLLTRKNNKAAP